MIAQWWTLYKKEMLEMRRNAKWLWVPVVFLLLGVMQPVTTYYTPQILKSAGGLPEGAVIQIPMPSAGEVLAKTLSQFGTLGVLILVLASMGMIASERASGVAGMIMIKPVPHVSYVTAKWASVLTLSLVSFCCGWLGAWYYTDLLIGHIELNAVVQGFLLYALWLAFIISITTLASASLKGNGAIAFVSILTTFVLSIAGGLAKNYMKWSPSRLSDQASDVLTSGTSSGLPLTLTVTFILIAGLLTAAVIAFKRKQLIE